MTWNLSDDPMRVGQALADAPGEPRAHVARHRGDPVRVAVAVHEVPRELLDGVRVLAWHHAGHVAPRRVGDHGDVPVAFAAGPVDADGLHVRAVLVEPGLAHVMADEPPRPRVVLADLRRDVRHRPRLGEFDDHGLEQEREPTAWPRPRHRNRPDAMGRTGHARHERVDVGPVLEEVQMAPRAFRRVVNRA